jgi:hypothetical protein
MLVIGLSKSSHLSLKASRAAKYYIGVLELAHGIPFWNKNYRALTSLTFLHEDLLRPYRETSEVAYGIFI